MIVDALLLAPEGVRGNAAMVASMVGRFGFAIASPVSSFTRATGTGAGNPALSGKVGPIPWDYLQYLEPSPYAVNRKNGKGVPVMGRYGNPFHNRVRGAQGRAGPGMSRVPDRSTPDF